MAKRKALSKKLRFEVFKRDSFKCQYCGRGAPEVVLHVDHIKPVKQDGGNDIFNLITSCADCNSGKGARPLSDNSELDKQKKELDLLNERREQIEMLMQWRSGLKSLHETEINALSEAFSDVTGYTLTDAGKKKLSLLEKRYSFIEVMSAIESSANFDPSRGDVIKYLSTICRAEREKKEKPWISDLYYVRGILRNRIRDYDRHSYKILPALEELYTTGIGIDKLKAVASSVCSWSEFITEVEEIR